MSKLLILLLCITACSFPQDGNSGYITEIENFNWLSGAWITEQDSSITEELWMEPKGKIMIGLGRTVSSDNKVFYEFMRIAQTDSGVFFFGSPKGENTTHFKLIKVQGKHIEFENLLHDFPQRIIYHLADNGELRARVEGIVEEKLESSEWNYRSNNNKFSNEKKHK